MLETGSQTSVHRKLYDLELLSCPVWGIFGWLISLTLLPEASQSTSIPVPYLPEVLFLTFDNNEIAHNIKAYLLEQLSKFHVISFSILRDMTS